MDITKIGTQIAAFRKEKGVKQEELASAVGVTPQAVSKWENGGVPDTELIPKIADYFGISADKLFGRCLSDYGNLHAALIKKILNTPDEEQFKTIFEFCWDMERAMLGEFPRDGSVADYEKDLGETEQRYSSILSDHGFTRMGIANRLQYFLLVPDARDTETAFFKGIDYPAFFKDFSEKNVFEACVFLHKREGNKAFTSGFLMKNMGVSAERAAEIIDILKKYKLISTTQIELDDETQQVYTFRPTPSFVAMLIFVREMIDSPGSFSYYSVDRAKPYLK